MWCRPKSTKHSYKASSYFFLSYTNVDSLLNKRTELEALVVEYDPDIIALTENFPKNYRYEMQKAELNLRGYTLHCEAKPDHRGICIHLYTKANLKASLCEKLTNSDFKESLWVNIDISRGQNLLVGCVYRSQSSNQENNILLPLLLNQSLETKRTH